MEKIETLWLPDEAHSMRLELRSCIPTQRSPGKAPILFMHGAFCSARDFDNLLLYLATKGHAAYALSLRGHGGSWTPSWFYKKIWTSIDDIDSDIRQALKFIRSKHSSSVPPILAGHSLGGGYAQYTLAKAVKHSSPVKVSSLILLGSAPLSGGGKQIMANWEVVETDGKGYDSLLSPRSQLDTEERVRKAFFSHETEATVVERWLTCCRTDTESLRAGLSVLWPFGEPGDVLGSIEGIPVQGGLRKILFISSVDDLLIPTTMVEANVAAYQKSLPTDSGQLANVELSKGGHHLMMDIAWKECAQAITEWSIPCDN